MTTPAVEKLELKDLGPLEIKDAERGEVEAVVATIGVVDRDKDVTQPGAIQDGSRVKMSSYAHNSVLAREMPVGHGVLRVEGDKVIFRGKMFMGTTGGREAFEVLKEMGSDQEWSFGYHVVESEAPDKAWRAKGAERMLTKLIAYEVSPVLVGAGRGTHTVAVKEAAPDVEINAENLTASTLEEPPEVTEEAKRLEEEAETKRLAELEAAIELAEKEAVLVRLKGQAAMDEYQRVQRTLKRLRVI